MKEIARRADKLNEVEKYERHVKTALVAETIILRDSVPTTSNAFSWESEKKFLEKVKFDEVKDHKKSDETNFVI